MGAPIGEPDSSPMEYRGSSERGHSELSLAGIGCSARLLNLLLRSGIETLKDLNTERFFRLAYMRGAGIKSLAELVWRVGRVVGKEGAHATGLTTGDKVNSLELSDDLGALLRDVGFRTIGDFAPTGSTEPVEVVRAIMGFATYLERDEDWPPEAESPEQNERGGGTRTGSPWFYSLPLDALDLTTRTVNAMTEAGLGSVEEVVEFAGPANIRDRVLKAADRLASLDPVRTMRVVGKVGPALSGRPSSVGGWARLHALTTSATLDEELLALAAGASERDRTIWLSRFGPKSAPRPTLEALGDSYNITRERARQVEARIARQIDGVTVRLPLWTDFILQLARERGIWEAGELTARYSDVGGELPHDVPAILAELSVRGMIPSVHLDAGLGLVLIGAAFERWIPSQRYERYRTACRRRTLRQFRLYGLVRALPETLIPLPIQHAIVLDVAGDEYGVLRTPRAWYLDRMPGTGAGRVIRKCFTVCGQMPLDALTTALPKLHRLGGLRGLEVEQMIRSASEFEVDESGLVRYSGHAYSLSDAEQASVEIARQFDGVVSWQEILEGMEARDWSVPTVNNCLRMPWFRRVGGGIYALIGEEENEERLAHIRAAQEARPALVLRDELISDGVFFVEYTMRGRVKDGVLPTPRWLREADSKWSVRSVGAEAIEVTMRNGFCWSLADWTRSCGVEEGGTFGAVFRTENESVVLSTDAAALLDELTDEDDSAVLDADDLFGLLGGEPVDA